MCSLSSPQVSSLTVVHAMKLGLERLHVIKLGLERLHVMKAVDLRGCMR